MADLALTPIIGSPCRVYPRDNGKIVGPVANTRVVRTNRDTASVVISKLDGSGSGVGSYQPQESDSADGPWNNIGSALSSAGPHPLALAGTYIRVVEVTEPDSGVSVRVCVTNVA